MKLEGLHEGILVSAEIETEATGECVRCLDPVSIPVQVEIQELFAYSLDEAFDFAVRDDHVDLEPVVRDAVVLALPFQPVCRPDCPGLDPETGEKLADNPERSPREVLDPRWAALEGFQNGLRQELRRDIMAVPKRKQSRANTHARRSQWKADARCSS